MMTDDDKDDGDDDDTEDDADAAFDDENGDHYHAPAADIHETWFSKYQYKFTLKY